MTLTDKIKAYIAPKFEHDASGHDLAHIERVLEMARWIQSKEGGDLVVIELAALLHDISDHKFNGGVLNAGGKAAEEVLLRFDCDPYLISRVVEIIDRVSYKGAGTAENMNSIEGQIVQDADRLDAIGAIGIGRAFAYGGAKGQAMYDPNHPVTLHDSFESYASAKSTTINHFYEKLLLLTERLNTPTARAIGAERHKFMQTFLDCFLSEWTFNSKE